MIGKIENTQDILQEKERLLEESKMHQKQIKANMDSIRQEAQLSNLLKEVLYNQTTYNVIKYTATVGSFALINKILPKSTSIVLRMAIPFVWSQLVGKWIGRNYPVWSNKLVESLEKK